MDRNPADVYYQANAVDVALRKESVDRNQQGRKGQNIKRVALRKESVDRNRAAVGFPSTLGGSLSARRAWIEMIDYIIDYATDAVALRKESVDRNRYLDNIEITQANVALRKESVDRNMGFVRGCLFCVVALRKESVDRNAEAIKPS